MATIYIDITALDVDFPAIEMAEKVLVLATMVFLMSTNAAMIIVRFIRQGSEVIAHAKYTLQTSMSLAGIGLALYPNVVIAVLLFQQDSNDLNCIHVYLARCYIFRFIPLIYGCGLVLLTFDTIARSRTASKTDTWQSKTYVCLLGVLPWLLALAVFCPLTLTNIDWDNWCAVDQTKTQIQAGIIVCSFAPVALVIIAGFFLLVLKSNRNHEIQDSFDSPMYDLFKYNETKHRKSSMRMKNLYVLEEDTKNNSYKFTANQESSTDFTDCPQEICGEVKSPQERIRKEKLVLIVSGIIFLFTEIPFNVLSLYITENCTHDGSLVYTVEKSVYITLSVFNWFKYIYPILMPVLWLGV